MFKNKETIVQIQPQNCILSNSQVRSDTSFMSQMSNICDISIQDVRRQNNNQFYHYTNSQTTCVEYKCDSQKLKSNNNIIYIEEINNSISQISSSFNQMNNQSIDLSNYIKSQHKLQEEVKKCENKQQNIMLNQIKSQNIQQITPSYTILIQDENDESKCEEITNNHDNQSSQNIMLIDSGDEQTDDNYDQDSSVLTIQSSKTNQQFYVNKVKKLQKIKSEKIKNKEYNLIPYKKSEIIKQKKFLRSYEKQDDLFLKFNQQVDNKLQFFIFCDICIEYDNILGKDLDQNKRSDTNDWKIVTQIIDHNNSSLLEILIDQNCDTQMEFQNCQKFLLSLQNQYAKQVSENLFHLQEKSRLAQETIKMISSNRATYEYLLKRKEHANMKYIEFKQQTLKNYKYYIYNHYVFDIRNGNITVNGIGISKDFAKFLSICPEYYKQLMSKYGILEFLKRDYKAALQISYFNQFAFNMKNIPQNIKFASNFITLDNIEVKLDVVNNVIDLCKEFDDINSFDCPLIDFVCIIIPEVTDEIEQSLSEIRKEQNIDINTLLEMDQDEINFYYNYESQQFLKKYYNDVYNKDIQINDFSHQTVDFTHQNM